MINVIKKLFLIATIIFLGTSASGCIPCFMHCESMLVAEAYVDSVGNIWIDIPERKKYKVTGLQMLGVAKINSSGTSDSIWFLSRKLHAKEKIIGEQDDFPLLYGSNPSEITTGTLPKKIDNGKYIIRGYASFIDKQGESTRKIYGKFDYKNGVVNNHR